MKIVFKGKYKSLTDFEAEALPKFVVLIGKNGTGKSQFLRLMNEASYFNMGQVKDYTTGSILPGTILSVTPAPLNIQIENLELFQSESPKQEILSAHMNQNVNTFFSLGPIYLKFLETAIPNGLDINTLTPEINLIDFLKDGTIAEKENQIRQLDYLFNPQIGSHPLGIKAIQKILISRDSIRMGLEVAAFKGKSLSELVQNDFYSTPLSEAVFANYFLYPQQLESLFFGYARKWLYNSIEYLHKKNERGALSPDAFSEKFKAPWLIINDILCDNDLPIRVSEINLIDFRPETIIDFYFYNAITNERILVQDFSSGERIIVGLIVRLFMSNNYSENLTFPDLLLLDEPDAHLHPQMTSILLRVLYETFAKKFGIAVIMSTHSIATIALAEEESIYQIQNIPKTNIVKVSKDEALGHLTHELPMLSIDYKRHKQIFVESPSDQKYYQNIFNKYRTEFKPPANLYFITTGYGKTNCDSVIKITNEIRASGNRTSFGIVDWDAKKNPTQEIYVHGHLARYSIENFILDPIYLVALFVSKNQADGVSELGFSSISNPYNIGQDTEVDLQRYADWVVKRLTTKFKEFNTSEKVTVSYANGKKIDLPSFYLQIKGHDLQTKLKVVFKSLSNYNDTDLLNDMSDVVAKCYPFVPIESYNLIRDLTNS